ncbi:hypothetical protein PDE_06645 [Penicillium oxalicum 114-2]|uniref:Uncharacterized protein n=1 Tax=Penicillium oxalicum (strain 114-2 / CGMCC 5302) TaxID=933388 RepID=S8AZ22_PENO1|nr:hypothetical protein PDE_06645 [Penicillium oxalicum 114-2]
MEPDSFPLIFLRRAVAMALAVTACRQLRPFYPAVTSVTQTNLLTVTADSMIGVVISTSTLFCAWHISGSTTESSAITATTLVLCRTILAGLMLVLAICGDTWLQKATTACVVVACWGLGWKVTTAEQRDTYWQFLKQGFFLKMLELWQKSNH